MKKFLLLLLVTIVTLACGPIDPNGQKCDENIRLGDVKYCYQFIDGNLVMTIVGTDQYGNIIHDIIPVSNIPIQTDTIQITVSKEMLIQEYDEFVDWYKENSSDGYDYTIVSALDLVKQLLLKYEK